MVLRFFYSDSADKLNKKLSKGLFMFAVSNSCMNPIVYGKLKMTKLHHNSCITRESKDFQIKGYILSQLSKI